MLQSGIRSNVAIYRVAFRIDHTKIYFISRFKAELLQKLEEILNVETGDSFECRHGKLKLVTAFTGK